MRYWHVVRVCSRYERVVTKKLVEVGERAAEDLSPFTPLYLSDAGRALPLLSGFVFARWETYDPYLWHEIRDLPFVLGFIGEPWPVQVIDPILDEWFRERDDEGIITLEENRRAVMRGFGEGDLVKLTAGPFKDVTGVCFKLFEGGARIKLSLLGREVDVYAAFNEIAALGDELQVASTRVSRARNRRERRRTRRYSLRNCEASL